MPADSLHRSWRLVLSWQWRWLGFISPSFLRRRLARARRILRARGEFQLPALALYGIRHVPQRQQTRGRVLLAGGARHCREALHYGALWALVLLLGCLLLGAASAPASPPPLAGLDVPSVGAADVTPVQEAQAQLALGLSHMSGAAQGANFHEAARWLHRAARQGLVSAFYFLGELYETGFGVARNRALAFALYTVAARDGSSVRCQARRALSLLQDRLNAADRHGAEDLTELLNTALPAHLDGEHVSFSDSLLRNLEASGSKPEEHGER
jgi:TPR repeat protein